MVSIGQSTFQRSSWKAGCRSVESIVELIGELVMFFAVSFFHHLSNSAHGAPEKIYRAEIEEDMNTREDQAHSAVERSCQTFSQVIFCL